MTYAPHPSRLFAKLVLGASLVACGLTQVDSGPSTSGPSADGGAVATPGCGSLRTNDCAEGLTCFGPSACGAPWKCQKELPCSAAPPTLGCGCDGRIVSLAAGCPERNAYGLWEAFGYAEAAKLGAPCDPTRTAPFSVALEIAGAGFDAYDGGRLWARRPTADGGVAPPFFPAEGIAIVGGRVAWSSEPSPRADGHYYQMLLDKNGDGRCDAGVDMAFAGTPDEVDAVRFVMRWALTPAVVATFAGAQTSYCEQWQ